MTIRPSGNSRATAGPPVSSARVRAADTTGRSLVLISREFMISSIFFISAGDERPCRAEQAAAYQRRMISCFEASMQTSSSVMQ